MSFAFCGFQPVSLASGVTHVGFRFSDGDSVSDILSHKLGNLREPNCLGFIMPHRAFILGLYICRLYIYPGDDSQVTRSTWVNVFGLFQC